MSGRIVVDDQGRTWSASSHELRRTMRVRGSDSDVAALLARLVGFIGISIKSTHTALVLNPRIVSGAALAAALFLMRDRGDNKFVVAPTGREPVQMYRSFAALAIGIEELIAAARRPITTEFSLSDLSIELIEECSPLGWILRWSGLCSGRFDREAWNWLLEEEIAGRWLLVEPQDSGPDFRVAACGSGYGVPTPAFCSQLPGALFSSLPDQRYMRWLAATYDEAFHRRRVVYQTARTAAYWPDVGIVNSEYVRLVVPLRDYRGRDLLLSASRRLGRSGLQAA